MVKEFIALVGLNSSQDTMILLPASNLPGGSWNGQSGETNITHLTAEPTFNAHENIHATRVETLSAGELGILFKNNLNGLS